MDTLLYNVLVNPNNSPEEEINRLERFRGLKTSSGEYDINAFLMRYFSKDSVPGFEVFDLGHYEIWAKCFASKSCLRDFYIDPLKLDPFIARYVIAINRIGIKTFCSCDGWHSDIDKNKVIIMFKERYSYIYHKIISSMFLKDSLAKWEYHNEEISILLPKEDKDKLDIYTAINKDAEYLEEKEQYFFSLKVELVNKLKGVKKNNLNNDEVESLLLSTLEDIINSHQ